VTIDDGGSATPSGLFSADDDCTFLFCWTWGANVMILKNFRQKLAKK
jgi:hypothetical protein